MEYEIYRFIVALSKPNNGWIKELNSVSWNGREPVYDIRVWNQDHSKFGKGVTLTPGEMMVLKKFFDMHNVF